MDAVAQFAAGIAAGDLDAISRSFAHDIHFRSPITNGARFVGRERVTELYAAVLETLSEVEHAQIAAAGDLRVLHGRARAGGLTFEEVQLARLDAEGLIVELTMFVRDLPALTALTAALGPKVARPHGRWRAALLAAMAWPLAWATRFADPLVARIAKLR